MTDLAERNLEADVAIGRPGRPLTSRTASRLRWANLAAFALHLAQAVAIALLTTDFTLPIVGSYLSDDPARLTDPPSAEVLADLRLGYAVAAFSALSALAHLLVATVLFGPYVRAIEEHRNPYRWIEYSFSASIMIVVITMLLGAFEIGTVIAVAGCNAAMILFGWVMERQNDPATGRVDWTPFVFGSIIGAVPWVVGAVYFAGALSNADSAVPAFVWGIFISLFVLFNCFAVNQFLQYRRVGRWRSYLFGEGAYIVLSFVAKSALAWQVFFGTLR